MNLITLLVAVIITALIVWLVDHKSPAPPWPWVIYAILVVVWLIVLLSVLGVVNTGELRLR